MARHAGWRSPRNLEELTHAFCDTPTDRKGPRETQAIGKAEIRE